MKSIQLIGRNGSSSGCLGGSCSFPAGTDHTYRGNGQLRKNPFGASGRQRGLSALTTSHATRQHRNVDRCWDSHSVLGDPGGLWRAALSVSTVPLGPGTLLPG